MLGFDGQKPDAPGIGTAPKREGRRSWRVRRGTTERRASPDLDLQLEPSAGTPPLPAQILSEGRKTAKNTQEPSLDCKGLVGMRWVAVGDPARCGAGSSGGESVTGSGDGTPSAPIQAATTLYISGSSYSLVEVKYIQATRFNTERRHTRGPAAKLRSSSRVVGCVAGGAWAGRRGRPSGVAKKTWAESGEIFIRVVSARLPRLRGRGPTSGGLVRIVDPVCVVSSRAGQSPLLSASPSILTVGEQAQISTPRWVA